MKFVLRDSSSRDYVIGEATTIGRDSSCQIILSGDSLVSRRHALLWAQGDALYVRDENSSNGTFVNGQRLTPNAATPLRVGDKLGVGSTLFLALVAEEPPPATVRAPRPVAAPVAPPTPAPSPRRRPAFWMACAAIGVIGALLLCGGGGLILAARGPLALPGLAGAATSAVKPSQSVLSTSTLLPLLSPQQYAASNRDLAGAVAQLNQAEVEFVRAATASTAFGAPALLARPALHPLGAQEVETRLLNVAANAFHTATIADRLSQTAAAQGGGSQAATTTGSQYRGIATLAASLVIDAQNARQGMAQGTLPPKDAASTVSEYGARLWNPVAINPTATGNPFTPLLPASAQIPQPQVLRADAVNQLTTQLGGNLTAWVATSAETVTRTLDVPQPTSKLTVNNDAATLAQMSTVDGQQNGDAARVLAADILQAGAGIDVPPDQAANGKVAVALLAGVAVSAPERTAASPPPLPAYPNGSGSAVTAGANPDDVISTVLAMGPGGDVKPGAQTPVKDTKPVVSLTISNITINTINQRPNGSSTFEADVLYEFDVQWTTTLIAPRFDIDCVGGNHFSITSASGSQHVSAKGLLILYPGVEDAYCYASNGGNSIGNATVRFLVGDAVQATQRAVQVETDSANLDLTLTAEAVGTQNAQSTNAEATKSVLGTQDALETEVAAQQTQEFAATITAIAHLTQIAIPPTTDTPVPTPTFVPVVVETLAHPGNVFAVTTKTVLQPNRLYQFCFSGEVFLVNPDRSVLASDIDHVNGIKVPLSGCLTLEGTGKAAVISCGQGEIAQDPGGFSIVVTDLGPI